MPYVERIIAWGRVFLSVSALITLYPAAEAIRLEFYLAAAYAVFALAWLFFILRSPVSGPPIYIVHGADILNRSVLMWTTEGSTSPFFVFFTFTLLAATSPVELERSARHYGRVNNRILVALLRCLA